MRSDFIQIKDNYMLHGLRLKFEQHEDLQHFLIQTGTMTLIYDTERDEYWGYGIAGSGKNRLGALLMLVRKEFYELSRVEWEFKQREMRHNFATSPPTMRPAKAMTFAESPRDLLDRLECRVRYSRTSLVGTPGDRQNVYYYPECVLSGVICIEKALKGVLLYRVLPCLPILPLLPLVTLYYRYVPTHSRPSLTNQQSFYDSHTSPSPNSPKLSCKPTLDHQESFVAHSTSRQDTFGTGGGSNPFGFMPIRNILSGIEKTNSE